MAGGVVVLHCAQGGREALDAMARAGLKLPQEVRTLELECTGRVNEVLLMETLEKGVRGVVVLGCRKENCKYLDGNLRAGRRVERVRQILNDAGIQGKMVEMVYAAPDEGRRLHAILSHLVQGVAV